jgi:hypothetical protein
LPTKKGFPSKLFAAGIFIAVGVVNDSRVVLLFLVKKITTVKISNMKIINRHEITIILYNVN